MKRKANRVLYLIDGVSVPRNTYFRRMVFGEYAGAKFEKAIV